MTIEIAPLISGVALFFAGEYIYLRFLRLNSEGKDVPGYKMPWKCRIKPHHWQDTGYLAQNFFMRSPVERCSRCRLARTMMLTGFQYMSPAESDTRLGCAEHIASGDVIPLHGPRPVPPPPTRPAG